MDEIRATANIPDFRRQIAELNDRIERKIAARALRAAGGVFRAGARRRAPPQLQATTPRRRPSTGNLRRAIYVGRSRQSRKGKPMVYVGVKATKAQRKRGSNPFYWRFLEGGWVPRGPGRKFGGGRRTRALRRARALKGGAHKVSYPFLAPTFAADQNQALSAFVDTMGSGLAEESRASATR